MVRELLGGGRYPTLGLMLTSFRKLHSMKLDAVELEEVWTFLEFVGKNFLRESVDLKQQRNEWLEAIRKPESQADDEHCLCKRYREDRTIPPSDRIDLLVLAGWDLLRLLSRVYDDLVPPQDTLPTYGHANRYKALLDKFDIAGDDSTILISLNYDTVLEDALTKAEVRWHAQPPAIPGPRRSDPRSSHATQRPLCRDRCGGLRRPRAAAGRSGAARDEAQRGIRPHGLRRPPDHGHQGS